MGIFFCDDEHEVLRRTEMAAKDHVAQLSVENPLLLSGLKFDIRAFVVVKSYHPFVAYMHRFALLHAAGLFSPLAETSTHDLPPRHFRRPRGSTILMPI
jgi:hypothetical protein